MKHDQWLRLYYQTSDGGSKINDREVQNNSHIKQKSKGQCKDKCLKKNSYIFLHNNDCKTPYINIFYTDWLAERESYNGGFWDSGTFPRFRVSFQRSSRTPLCHFDKLEGQHEQVLGQRYFYLLPSIFLALLEDSTLSSNRHQKYPTKNDIIRHYPS